MTTPIEALQGVVNANQALPTVLTAGQPAPEHFRALKQAGVRVVIDIRAPEEPRGCDEPKLLRDLGLEYINIAVTDGTLTNETLDRVTEVMRQHAHEPVLVHCASGNRVGGALIPHLILDRGFTEDEATMAALRMGLRGAHLLQWGLEYTKTHGKQ